MSSLFHQGYAVVIGVGADLPVTVDDATAVATLLRDPTRCAYPSDQVRLLIGPSACKQNLLDALDWLATKVVNTDSTAIVYFSGHGIETPDYYLMPYGYDLTDLPNTALAGQVFTEKLRRIQAKKLLVLLDCCHAGGQAEAKSQIKSPLPPGLVDELSEGSGRVVIGSSHRDEKSWAGNPYSVFTTALLEAFAGYGAFEHDGYARVLDLALWVGRKTPERTGDKQHPILKVGNLTDNFALAWYAGGAKNPQPLPWMSSVSVITPRVDTTQVATWQRIWANYRENLLLIEERMSEYVEFSEIPLQLLKNKRHIEAHLTELAFKLGLNT